MLVTVVKCWWRCVLSRCISHMSTNNINLRNSLCSCNVFSIIDSFIVSGMWINLYWSPGTLFLLILCWRRSWLLTLWGDSPKLIKNGFASCNIGRYSHSCLAICCFFSTFAIVHCNYNQPWVFLECKGIVSEIYFFYKYICWQGQLRYYWNQLA